MVLLIGSAGLRRSEMITLTWPDLNISAMEANILRSCIQNKIGTTKTELALFGSKEAIQVTRMQRRTC
jgi:hypothetical protein